MTSCFQIWICLTVFFIVFDTPVEGSRRNRHRKQKEGKRDKNNHDVGYCGQRPYDNGDFGADLFELGDNPFVRRRKEPGMKIVGGNDAPHGKFPWQVGFSIYNGRREDGSVIMAHFCGGTIISEFWIVSASHCFKHMMDRTELMIAYIGDNSRQEIDVGEQRFLLDKVILHENYTDEGYDYDIALVKVQPDGGRGIQFDDFAQPACLPTASTRYVGNWPCEVSGWGDLNAFESITPDILQFHTAPLISPMVCRNIWGNFSARVFCAGHPNSQVNPCSGDSGGPLVCKVNGVYTLMGVVDFVPETCVTETLNKPGVFAKVKKYLPWIFENLQEHSTSPREETLPLRP